MKNAKREENNEKLPVERKREENSQKWTEEQKADSKVNIFKMSRVKNSR